MTYDEWLALSDEERDDVHLHQWNVYARDGLAIAFMAATRLAMEAPYTILDISVGTYHGGEYLLHLTVSREDHENCPRMLEQTFEGFRVVWICEPGPPSELLEHPLLGTWDSNGDGGNFLIDIAVENDEISVKCRERPELEEMPIVSLGCEDHHIIFYTNRGGVERRHDLFQQSDDDPRMRHHVTTYQFAERRPAADT